MRMLTRADFGNDSQSEEAWNLYTAAVAREPMTPDKARRVVECGIRSLLVRAWVAHKDKVLMELQGATGDERVELEQELRLALDKIKQAKAYKLGDRRPQDALQAP